MKVRRVFDLLDNYNELFQKEDALVGKKNGKWVKISTQAYFQKSHLIAYSLLELGLKKGDKVASVSNNCPEWNMMDMAVSMAGLVHVPIYPTISERSFEYVLNHCEAKVFFVANKELYDQVSPVLKNLPHLQHVFTFENIDEAKQLDYLLELGRQCTEKNKSLLTELKTSIQADDLATILYTSGTTGVPKGVMLSHHNLISNVKASTLRLKLDDKHRVLSFLPLNHVYERIMNYQCQYKGVSVYYAEDMSTIGDNLKEIKPHGFATVPRLLEKVYDKIVTKSKSLSLPKRWIFHWAIDLGTKYDPNPNTSSWYRFQLKLANKLVFSKWREALGGNLQFIGSGGAALQQRLERVFWAAGLRIQEGYGLTETSPIISTNMDYWPEVRFGTVGTLLEGIKVKIAEDGEILTKGPNIMLGYYKDPEKTKEVIDKEGWFHTGDIGKMVDERFLKITDRKKEIFKTSGGKYIAPQVIENYLKESIFIDQAMVIGEKRRFPAVIISPNFEFIHQYCMKKKIQFQDNTDIIKNERINRRFQKEINKINKRLDHHMQVKAFRLVSDSWTPLTGELSPTLKLKRKVLKLKYEEIYEEIYHKELDEYL